MKLIAHRGNVVGPNIDLENHPKYIENALAVGFDAEIDLWFIDSELKFYLGHDAPQYLISFDWLDKHAEYLWIHCKNNKAIFEMSKVKHFNYFWHQSDNYTITSAGYIWAYPGQEINLNSILVLPEKNSDIFKMDLSKVNSFGVCSDYVKNLLDYK